MRFTKQSLMGLSCGVLVACAPPPVDDCDGPCGSGGTDTHGAAGSTGGDGPSPGSGTTTGGADGSSSSGAGDTSSSGDTGGEPEAPVDPNDGIPAPDEEGCPAIYAQDLLPTFELTLHPEVWEQLQWEWNNGLANEEAGLAYNPYHSIEEFRYGDVVIHDAAIRLRGNTSNWDPVPGNKMQLQIGFHTQDPNGHFWGQKRMVLESASANRHMLRDRLALAFMRKAGVRAPCANHARLTVNGEYYGIFANIEKLDEVFLQRTMEDPTGDLFKRANWELKTNEDTATDERLDALRDAETTEELVEYLDAEQALLTFAADAVIPNSDGPWAGGLNGYYYDDPYGGKFMLLPWDLDNTFERFNDGDGGDYPDNPDPFTWEKPTSHGRPFYELLLEDPVLFDFYIDTIDQILHQAYQPDDMLAWVDQWSAQIEQSVLDDVNKPYDNDTYYEKLDELREFIPARYAFVDEWLQCWQNGGEDDGSGQCDP